MKKKLPKILTIAGSDPSCGAGIQADLEVFQTLKCRSVSVITAVTAQNERHFLSVNPVSAGILRAQLASVGKVDFVKIGMLGTRKNVQEVITYLKKTKPKVVVLDTVFCSSTGIPLLSQIGIHLLKKKLLPLCTLVTPNLDEAEVLTGMKVRDISSMKKAALKVYQIGFGVKAVLIKGGHLQQEATDVLYDGRHWKLFKAQKRWKKDQHGTGCKLSAAIAAYLALGQSLPVSIQKAKIILENQVEIGP